MDFWLQLIGFVVFGMVVGTYGTLIGAGGGFIIVPVLLLVLGWPHQQAVATSLLVVTANATSGTLSYSRQKRVDFRTGIRFAAATVPGAIIGSFVVEAISGQVFNDIFGVLLIAISIFLMIRPERPRSEGAKLERPTGLRGWGWTVRHLIDSRGEEYDYAFSLPLGILLSFVVGFLSSILGIGGGIIHVPALITLFDFPAHIATATSNFILAISAATGTTTQLVLGNVQIVPGLEMAAGALVGAQIGGAISHRVQGRWIVRGLAAALILVGIRLIIG